MEFKEFSDLTTSMELVGKQVKISKNLRYHIDNKISLCENVFRIYSKSYFNLINEARDLYNKDLIKLNDEDADLVETDIGKTETYKGRKVHLDTPILLKQRLDEAEYQGKKVSLNKPMRTPGGPKKFRVFVKDGDKIKIVRFGDSKSSGLSIKNNSPARAKSFRARHKCAEKKDKTTPGYWACNVARYSKSLGLKSDRPW